MRSLPLLLCAAAALCACREQVHHGLSERDANEVVTALAERGVDASKAAEKGKRPTWAVEVPARQVSRAVRLLTDLKLPRPPRALTRDVVVQTGLVDTPAAERLRQLEGVEGDLEEALESLDGVVSASVEVSSPAPWRGGPPAPVARAAVLLRVRAAAEERLRGEREALRALVAGGVEGLRPEDVALFVDVAAERAVAAPEPASGRSLVWGLLGAMLTFAAGFLWLLRGRLAPAREHPAAPGPVAPSATLQSGAAPGASRSAQPEGPRAVAATAPPGGADGRAEDRPGAHAEPGGGASRGLVAVRSSRRAA